MFQIIYILLTFVLFVCVSIATPNSVHAAPPKDFQTTQIIGTGLAGPSGFDIAPDGRIFILQRTGEVKLYKNGQLLSQNFVTLPSIAEGDRGLIGITFDPNFSSNKLVYFYYTGLDKRNRLVRMDASTDIGKDLMVLYETTFLSEQLHVGGSIGFGLDGKLYLAVGDNGYPPNSQDLSNPHGKILRINRDGSIPVDNPFYGQPGKLPEIWAYGLRNPWRFQFDSVTGRLYDGDVGGSTWEEINLIQKGKNYGWPNAEGVCSWSGCPYANPAYTYPHLDNGRYYSSAVTQGPIYRGSSFPQSYNGRVFFGDYARGFIKTFTTDADGNSNGVQDFDLQAGSVVDLKVASDGSLYYITYYPGALYKVTYNPANRTPVANATSDKTKGTDPFTVVFSSDGSYDPDGTPLTYSWNFGDGTSSTQANPTKTYITKGTYNATLTVSDGVNTALSIPIVIQVGIPPKVTIGSPNDGATYRAGDKITYTAIALDAAGFDINDNDIVSEVIFHHDTHIHPFLGPLRGRSHTFTIPTSGEDSPNTWYAIHVTATDTNGLSTTETVEIYPVKSIFALKTEPEGLKVTLQGAPITTPRLVEAVVGYELEVNVPDGQIINGKEYIFSHWSDGGAKKHTIVTPDANVTYTAHFLASTNVTTTIYDETLRDGWSDWSWSSANNFNDTAKPYTGQKNIQWKTTSSWAGLYLHTDNGFDTTGQQSLTLAVQATKQNQKLGVQLYGSNNEKLGGNFVDITPYGGDPVVGSYKIYTIPMSVLSGVDKRINGLHIQDTSGQGTNELYIDKIGFVSSQVAVTPTPTQSAPTPTAIPATPTPTQSGPTPAIGGPTPTPTSSVLQQLVIYDESLRSGWEDWSWSSTNNFADSSKPFAGTKNMRWQANASWAGLYLHATATLKTQGYEALQFSIQATKDNQSLAVQLYDAQHNYIGNPVSLDTYGGKVPVGVYKTYTIPLSAVSGVNKDIRGFYIQDTSGQTANVLFLDNIMFIGTSTATPTPTQSAPTPTPTSVISLPTPTTAIPTPTPTQTGPTPTPALKQLTIFDDALSSGWVDWSWSSTNNFGFTTESYVGTKSLQWKPISGYAGLYLHSDNSVNLSDYTDITFAIKATKSDQEISLMFYDNNNATLGTAKVLSAYGGKPSVGTYKVYTLSLQDLGVANKPIKGLHLQDVSGSNTNELFIDAVKLLHNGSSTPTPTLPPSPGNSIPNNSMEVAEGDRPASWFSNTWGANNALFSYVTNGRTGNRSLRTEITSYSSGNAKWYFASQNVSVGKQYTFVNYYKSNVTTYVVLQYTMNDGSHQYVSLKEAPSSNEWNEYKDTFVVPTNVASLSIFHIISTVGYLQVDDYSLVQQ